jgi:hypothetical protein
VAVNSIYASIIPSYKYNLVLKSFSYGTLVMGHPVLSVDIKSWDIQNLLIVYQTFESSLKIKIVIRELNFNLMFLTICHKFYNLIVKSQIYPM